ncbi:division/cell wall cluster transcriptional repressor MraZ [candidate division WWE3 bacterium]|nr:division/cell wall cluster transcriptional repressor MraZ [candidate division WWE3 bacterium]
MKMFLGEYSPNITEGSRVALPKKIREQIEGDRIILSRGFEKCVMVYDHGDWVAQAQRQVDRSSDGVRMRDLERYMYASAVEVGIDAQGRVVIPTSLKEYAGIKEKTAVVGVGDHVEIWDGGMWRAYLDRISGSLDRLA